MFDWQEERLAAEGQSDEGWSQAKERGRIQSDGWVVATAVPIREVDVEPLDYDLDISREVNTYRSRTRGAGHGYMLILQHVTVHPTAVQTAESPHPGALRGVGPRRAPEPGGGGGALASGPTHEEPLGQIQARRLRQRLILLSVLMDFKMLCLFRENPNARLTRCVCVASTVFGACGRPPRWTSASWTRLCSSRRGS